MGQGLRRAGPLPVGRFEYQPPAPPLTCPVNVPTLSSMERTSSIEIRVSPSEKLAMKDAAERAQRSLSDWLRLVALKEATK